MCGFDISSPGALDKQWDDASVVVVLDILFAPHPNPNLLLLMFCGIQRKIVSDVTVHFIPIKQFGYLNSEADSTLSSLCYKGL